MCAHIALHMYILCTHFIYVPASIFTNQFLLISYSSLNHSKMRYSLCEYCGDISYCLLLRFQLFSSISWQKFVFFSRVLNISSKMTTFLNIKTSHSSYMLVVLHILWLQRKLSYNLASWLFISPDNCKHIVALHFLMTSNHFCTPPQNLLPQKKVMSFFKYILYAC